MESITRKSDLQSLLDKCIHTYESDGLNNCISHVKREILDRKVKFPLLESGAAVFYEVLKEHEHLPFCDQIQQFKTIGENVITGIILQKRLKNDLRESFQKSTQYLEQAHIWYICDIIGERVFGYGLLHDPEKAFSEIEWIAKHPINWVRRGLGAGFHYAIKKGLSSKDSERAFSILLTMANSKDKEIRQGIGWAAKTTAKFHPAIIEKYAAEIEDQKLVANWFRRKIRIGLERHTYAKRN